MVKDSGEWKRTAVYNTDVKPDVPVPDLQGQYKHSQTFRIPPFVATIR